MTPRRQHRVRDKRIPRISSIIAGTATAAQLRRTAATRWCSPTAYRHGPRRRPRCRSSLQRRLHQRAEPAPRSVWSRRSHAPPVGHGAAQSRMHERGGWRWRANRRAQLGRCNRHPRRAGHRGGSEVHKAAAGFTIIVIPFDRVPVPEIVFRALIRSHYDSRGSLRVPPDWRRRSPGTGS